MLRAVLKQMTHPIDQPDQTVCIFGNDVQVIPLGRCNITRSAIQNHPGIAANSCQWRSQLMSDVARKLAKPLEGLFQSVEHRIERIRQFAKVRGQTPDLYSLMKRG